MRFPFAAPAAAFLVPLFGTGSAFEELEVVESSCNTTTYFSVRSAWASADEPCHQKISLDMWAFMKGHGSAKDPDAQHVYVECMQQPEMGLVELITPRVWNTDIVSAAPGQIVGETENAATILCKGAEDFEAICEDEEITKAERVEPILASNGPTPRNPRRMQTTTSEAGASHKVDELIKGLEDLDCSRTRGENQTICVVSDSFNNNDGVEALQAFGDLPEVLVVKDLTGVDSDDEGSAMIELAFDIASGANFKFNSGAFGIQTFADDIGVLAGAEECDVIVDDIRYILEPSFRDGEIAKAVDAATQGNDILYFTSASNDGLGHRFVSDWECQGLLFSSDEPPCLFGVSAHVFDPSDPSVLRYFFPFISTSTDRVFVKWDEDEGSARDMSIILWQVSPEGEVSVLNTGESPVGVATAAVTPPGDGQLYLITIHQLSGSNDDEIDMHLVSWGNQFGGTTAASGSMFGHACAANSISVAAINHGSASGEAGAFADPETASVEDYSSRGPCIVDGGQGLKTRSHPVTTAADGLQTTTLGFENFVGTSAAAPVAAAIAAIIRAACFPRVVTYSDMMEMLTDYDYTIDATSDAGGAAETFGAEAGNGIISAEKMCKWVEQNCAEACPNSDDAVVHGDPHLVGLAGQKFDFTGQTNSWYALLSAWGTEHVNMRVTAPIAGLVGVTYITGISVQAEDYNGVGHSIVVFVSDPSQLDTSCPGDGQPCIGDGALTVLLDGESVTSPGQKVLGPGVSFAAANIPGECRPFGFERYWQQKVREAELLDAQSRRRLSASPPMDRWIADDTSATNPTECKEYVHNAVEHGNLFTHQSDHVSFQLITPNLTLRLNHGKLHQLPERDPTDTFDIPDHNTFQMNLGLLGVKRDDSMQGIIGETSVPTVNEHGARIMSGLEAIRGQEEDYKVDGAHGKAFKQFITGV